MCTRAHTAAPVHFHSQGSELYGCIVPPQRQGAFPAVVLGHGFGSDHRAMLPVARSPSVEGRSLAGQGVASLCFGFRGHGRSQGGSDSAESGGWASLVCW